MVCQLFNVPNNVMDIALLFTFYIPHIYKEHMEKATEKSSLFNVSGYIIFLLMNWRANGIASNVFRKISLDSNHHSWCLLHRWLEIKNIFIFIGFCVNAVCIDIRCIRHILNNLMAINCDNWPLIATYLNISILKVNCVCLHFSQIIKKLSKCNDMHFVCRASVCSLDHPVCAWFRCYFFLLGCDAIGGFVEWVGNEMIKSTLNNWIKRQSLENDLSNTWQQQEKYI